MLQRARSFHFLIDFGAPYPDRIRDFTRRSCLLRKPILSLQLHNNLKNSCVIYKVVSYWAYHEFIPIQSSGPCMLK